MEEIQNKVGVAEGKTTKRGRRKDRVKSEGRKRSKVEGSVRGGKWWLGVYDLLSWR